MEKLSQRPDTGFFGVDGGRFKIGNKTQFVSLCFYNIFKILQAPSSLTAGFRGYSKQEGDQEIPWRTKWLKNKKI